MLRRSTLQLLRFHFSLFLIPVFLFALSQLPEFKWKDAILVFFILHLLVYPSSNGYNSYMDRDTTPIGGLEKPLQPTGELFLITVMMDIAAVLLSLLINVYFTIGVLIYIVASRAYSYRGIRLKKYPVTGYLVVVICQGALIFWLVYHGCSPQKTTAVPILPMLAASALIGGYYPLTQIYQHDADLQDNVRTISYLLGKRGTFVFCGIVFALATLCMFFTFRQKDDPRAFWLFLIFMAPMVIFFVRWMLQVWKDVHRADFRSSLTMNLLAAICTGFFFGLLIIMKGI